MKSTALMIGDKIAISAPITNQRNSCPDFRNRFPDFSKDSLVSYVEVTKASIAVNAYVTEKAKCSTARIDIATGAVTIDAALKNVSDFHW